VAPDSPVETHGDADAGVVSPVMTCTTIAGMADDDWYKSNAPQPPPRVPKPGEPLWAFVRERDKKRF